MLSTQAAFSSRIQLAGFTLPELLCAMAIFSILVTAGIPSMMNFFKRYEAEITFRSFKNIASYARVEAITRRRDVVLCPRKANTEECGTGAGDGWKQGWLLFVDRGDSPTDITAADGDVLLKVYESVADDIDIELGGSTGSSRLDYIRFMARGNSFPSNPSALFCQKDSDDVVNFAGKIIIFRGRLRVEDSIVSKGECDAL